MTETPNFQSPEFSRFSAEQIAQIRELYSGVPAKIDEEGLRNSIEAEWKYTPPGLELPTYNIDGTRRQIRGFYPLTIPESSKYLK
jgi:hypothetical protein